MPYPLGWRNPNIIQDYPKKAERQQAGAEKNQQSFIVIPSVSEKSFGIIASSIFF